MTLPLLRGLSDARNEGNKRRCPVWHGGSEPGKTPAGTRRDFGRGTKGCMAPGQHLFQPCKAVQRTKHEQDATLDTLHEKSPIGDHHDYSPWICFAGLAARRSEHDSPANIKDGLNHFHPLTPGMTAAGLPLPAPAQTFIDTCVGISVSSWEMARGVYLAYSSQTSSSFSFSSWPLLLNLRGIPGTVAFNWSSHRSHLCYVIYRRFPSWPSLQGLFPYCRIC